MGAHLRVHPRSYDVPLEPYMTALRPTSEERRCELVTDYGEPAMDERRFVAAVSPYLRDMVFVALALIGPVDAEDAAQEALMRAWKAAPSLREGDTVRAWLLRITANVCHDWRRGRNGTWARLMAFIPDVVSEVGAIPAEDADPGSSDAVERLDLRRLVDALDDDLRAVVALRYYAEMNASEIGTALNIPASTVRTRLQRAVAQLRASGGFEETNQRTGAHSHEER